MPDELPVACSLSAGELPQRLQTMAALGRDALLDSRTHGPRAQLRFAAGAGVRERLDAIVAAESDCCAFLAMHVTDEPDTVVLTLQAPDDAEVALAELVDAFAGSRSRGRSC
jgi:hypothetical protein